MRHQPHPSARPRELRHADPAGPVAHRAPTAPPHRPACVPAPRSAERSVANPAGAGPAAPQDLRPVRRHRPQRLYSTCRSVRRRRGHQRLRFGGTFAAGTRRGPSVNRLPIRRGGCGDELDIVGSGSATGIDDSANTEHLCHAISLNLSILTKAPRSPNDPFLTESITRIRRLRDSAPTEIKDDLQVIADFDDKLLATARARWIPGRRRRDTAAHPGRLSRSTLDRSTLHQMNTPPHTRSESIPPGVPPR